MYKSFDNQHLKNIDGNSTPAVYRELSIEQSSLNHQESFKSFPGNGSRDCGKGNRCYHRSPCLSLRENVKSLPSNSNYSETESDTSSRCRSHDDWSSSNNHRQNRRSPSLGWLAVIQQFLAYFETALYYEYYRLVDRPKHHNDDMGRHIAKRAKRLEVQLNLQMFDEFDHITIWTFLPAL